MKKLLLSAAFVTAISLAFVTASPFSASAVEFDHSSKEAFDASTKAYAETLTKEERIQIFAGMMQLMWNTLPEKDRAEADIPFAKLMIIGVMFDNAHIILSGVDSDDMMEAGKNSEFLEIATNMVNKSDEDKAAAQPEQAAKIDATLACLRKKVTFSNINVEHSEYGVTYLNFSVTNNMDWPISFIYFEADVKSANRAVSWETRKSGLDISGGIEPGETREKSINIFDTPKDAKDLVVTMSMLDVADGQKRQLFNNPKFTGNSDDTSPNKCE